MIYLSWYDVIFLGSCFLLIKLALDSIFEIMTLISIVKSQISDIQI